MEETSEAPHEERETGFNLSQNEELLFVKSIFPDLSEEEQQSRQKMLEIYYRNIREREDAEEYAEIKIFDDPYDYDVEELQSIVRAFLLQSLHSNWRSRTSSRPFCRTSARRRTYAVGDAKNGVAWSCELHTILLDTNLRGWRISPTRRSSHRTSSKRSSCPLWTTSFSGRKRSTRSISTRSLSHWLVRHSSISPFKYPFRIEFPAVSLIDPHEYRTQVLSYLWHHHSIQECVHVEPDRAIKNLYFQSNDSPWRDPSEPLFSIDCECLGGMLRDKESISIDHQTMCIESVQSSFRAVFKHRRTLSLRLVQILLSSLFSSPISDFVKIRNMNYYLFMAYYV